ncbi:hypothetical protein B0H14DRAFT_2805422 [Mycena olivaceomarginata]|nr:hypothetical protein B0H14DRAFT_2805422 [Mycena olivaceomarginata]
MGPSWVFLAVLSFSCTNSVGGFYTTWTINFYGLNDSPVYFQPIPMLFMIGLCASFPQLAVCFLAIHSKTKIQTIFPLAVVYLGVFSSYLLQLDAVGLSITLITRIIQLAALILSTIWATATIRKSRAKITRQRFEFLGGCRRSETYTISRILLNRSASRPLVRGEYASVAVIRAIILSLLCLMLPAFAIYTIILSPLNENIFIRQIKIAKGSSSSNEFPPFSLAVWSPVFLESVSVNQQICPTQLQNINIFEASEIPVPPDYAVGLWQCPLATNSKPFNFTASTFLFTQSINGPLFDQNGSKVLPTPRRRDILYVQIGKGDDFNDMIQHTDPISLFPGTHLAATLTWTQRKVVTLGLSSLLGAIVPSKAVLVAEVHALQVDPRYNSTDSLSSSTLSIFQTRVNPTRFIQEYAESSAIAGLATVGGFWTFVDGTFVLFFGANKWRRPLSALGIVHFFQRRRLVQQWHEDFPALRTEGGRPGSEQAGIRDSAGETDSEAQNKPSDT